MSLKYMLGLLCEPKIIIFRWIWIWYSGGTSSKKKKKKKNTPANAGDAIGSGLISGSG